MKICVAGLGQVGLPTAEYILSKGFVVHGYDLSEFATKRAEARGIKSTTDWSSIPDCDVYVLCVSTLINGEIPDVAPIIEVSRLISKRVSKGTLVSFESTLPVGTSRSAYTNIFGGKGRVIHVPHRFWPAEAVKHGVNQPRVIGGINGDSLEKGQELYGKGLSIPLHPVSSIELAEMTKIAENGCRYVEIAFAQELRMICEKLGMDFNKVRDACNTKWNINIKEARDGVGGHCLPKDIRYLLHVANSAPILRSAIKSNDEYVEWLGAKTKN